SKGVASVMPVQLKPTGQLGRYRILEPLGAGGMGDVYLAQDTRLGRRVALKVMKAELAARRDARQRFDREAQAAALLPHPNLCPIYDVGEDNGTPYLVMEFIEGKPLGDLIDSDNPWPPSTVLALVQKLAAAIGLLHEHGIVHRDLKPDNILIRPGG